MRFKFDPHKSELIKENPERGISFGEAKAIWEKPYYEDFRNDDPEQFRAIGWVGDKLFRLSLRLGKIAKASTFTW